MRTEQRGGKRERDDYNSEEFQGAAKHAITNKQGFKWTYRAYSMLDPYEKDWPETPDTEKTWIIDQIPEGLGLDIGCGHMKHREDAVGVDLTPAGTSGWAGGQRGAVSVADVVADANDLPQETNSQDYVIASHLLEHMIDPIASLDEWNRVLKIGGRLILVVPDEDLKSTIPMDSTHLHAFTARSLTKLLLRMGGWTVDEVAHEGQFSLCITATKVPVKAWTPGEPITCA